MKPRARLRRLVVLAAILALFAVGSIGYVLRERAKSDRLLADGEQALAAREYARARDRLDHYLAERPADTRARLLAARAARQTRAYSDAREHLRQCRADGGEAEPIAIEESLIDILLGDEKPIAALRERAANYHCSIVLCTATQPAITRRAELRIKSTHGQTGTRYERRSDRNEVDHV